MTLQEAKVVVVGGSSGIGHAVAAAALARGANVTIVGRSRDKLTAALETIALPFRARTRTIAADATREEEVVRLFTELGAFDHLVVTAVTGAYAPIASMDLAAARTLVDSKLIAAVTLAKHAAGKARATITFTSGIAKDRPMPGGSVVAAVNGALGSFARALAIELAPVRVNVVSPGWVDTPVWDRIAGENGKAAAFEKMAARLPVGRIGTPDDLAAAYLFLMENGFTTGTTLHVDGGHALV